LSTKPHNAVRAKRHWHRRGGAAASAHCCFAAQAWCVWEYRNFYTPERNGIFLGFRSVSPECRNGLRAHRRPQAKQHGLRIHPTPP
jgi:hypothetical protein